jgi:GNAT superfamily N-acetyltransferase
LPSATPRRSAPPGRGNSRATNNRRFYVDSRTPEVTIGVSGAARGQGVGASLLSALIAEAARRGLGLCLNVRHDNPARRLYERHGFRLVAGSAVPNRVGGTSFAMIWAAPR